MRLLLVTPPMTQLNTPYPATAYLTGFLRSRDFDCRQADPAIELVLRLLSKRGLQDVRKELENGVKAAPRKAKRQSPAVTHFLAHADAYERTVDGVVRYLQGKDPTLALRIAAGGYLPEGPRFRAIDPFVPEGGDGDPLAWAFGALGTQDRAKYLASLYIDDLADVIRDGVDPRFELSRYGEKLAASAPTFDALAAALAAAPTLVDRYLDEIAEELLKTHEPDVLGVTAPFPGNVYAGFRMAQTAKRLRPGIKTLLGGGYVNTELRSLAEPRVFDFFDYVTLDDGERPIVLILEGLRRGGEPQRLLRTYVRENGAVVLKSTPGEHDVPFKDSGVPTYDGLALDRYISLAEMLNPMHRIWSDGRWNKLTLAHGCYWRKCNFCDVNLDYIGRYEDQSADLVVDKIQALIAETGDTGFHFVDEAAPPKQLFALASRLIARDVQISWWGNVRFEKTFTPELVRRMADSGLVAISGGLEVASDRLLKLMNKGVTVEQVARVAHAFAEAGVLVHAYLMYGFPTQTVAETVDALERVRQLFAAGCIHSAFWHRFSATAHSPIGRDPDAYGIRIIPPAVPVTFAENDLDFEDPSGVDHDRLGLGLKKALYNFMHGIGLDEDVRIWFDMPVPKPKVPKNLVAAALRSGKASQSR